MSSRRKITPDFEKHSGQAPGMMRHGSFPGHVGATSWHAPMDRLPPPHEQLLENKIAFQAADIEKFARENHKLATSQVTLRQELISAQQEVQRLKAHIGSIHTESDIQIRVLLEKIAKMEFTLKSGEGVKKDLKEARFEAQGLAKSRQELFGQVQKANEELQKARNDAKSLTNLCSELYGLRQEHQRLCAIFEHEKGVNIEKVEQMKAMEKNLFGMAREVERLCTIVSNEKSSHGPNPYVNAYANPNPSFAPPPMQGDYGLAHYPYSGGNLGTGSGMVAGVALDGGNFVWGGTQDPSLTHSHRGA